MLYKIIKGGAIGRRRVVSEGRIGLRRVVLEGSDWIGDGGSVILASVGPTVVLSVSGG
jgi:hypothetical protein